MEQLREYRDTRRILKAVIERKDYENIAICLEETVSEFLERRPTAFRDEIRIFKNGLCKEEEANTEELNTEELNSEWGEITATGNEIEINYWTICDLAEKYNFKSGFWYCFLENHETKDIWEKVCRSLVSDEGLGAVAIKASLVKVSLEQDEIRIHNADYTNKNDIFAIEKFLRNAGVKAEVRYKPDIYNHLVIYKENVYAIRPSIYKSIPNDVCETPEDFTVRSFLNEDSRQIQPQIIEYNMGKDNGGLTLDQWRIQYPPSRLSSMQCGIRRIKSRSYCDLVTYTNLKSMLRGWRHTIWMGTAFQHGTIDRLSTEYDIKSGRWVFNMRGEYKVDVFWKFVVRGFQDGKLDNVAISAEVLPEHSPGMYVIKVYNKNYFDTEEVYRLEHLLRGLGVKCAMSYTPAIYSHLGLYHKNFKSHGMNPTIAVSRYDARKRESIIVIVRELNAGN